MIISDLISNSVFSSIATVKDTKSLDTAYGFIQHNYSFIQHFDKIVISLNKMEGCSDELVRVYAELWEKSFEKVNTLFQEENKGHMFGTIDLEESILRFVKEKYPDTTYLFKSSEDVLLAERLIYLDILPCDFYFLPAFSYESLIRSMEGVPGDDSAICSFVNNCLPQTNFYILNISGIDSLYGQSVVKKRELFLLWEKQIKGAKPWEFDYGDGIKFDMETLLQNTANNLSKFLLLREKTSQKLFNFVRANKVGDPSHKNIYFADEGICHFHYSHNEVFLL